MTPRLDKLEAEFAGLLICTQTTIKEIYTLLCEESVLKQNVSLLTETCGFQIYQIIGIWSFKNTNHQVVK